MPTHIIVKNGRVAVQNGRVVTSAGGAPCCCGGGTNDVPCPDETDFCLRASIAGISVTCETFTNFSGITGVPISLILDGPINGNIVPGLFVWEDQSGFRNSDTLFSVSIEVSCGGDIGGERYPQLDRIRIETAGGGSTGPGASADSLIFLWDGVRYNGGPIRLDGGPVTVTNDLGEAPFDPCGDGQISTNGAVTIEVTREEVCAFDVFNRLIAVACDGSGDEIVVNPTSNDGGLGVLYQDRLFRIDRRGQGTPVAVTWVDESCIPTPEWPLARECGGTRTVTFDPSMRPAGALTFIVAGVTYTPDSGTSTADPASGTWSNNPCPTNSGPCAGLSPNDPRCDLPQYQNCPQCVGTDIGDPIIIPTDPRGSTPPDNDTLIESHMSPITKCRGCGG